MGICKRGSRFEFGGIRTGERAKFASGVFAPGRLPVVGEDFGLRSECEFRVEAIRGFQVEGVSAGFGVTLASDRTVERNGQKFGEGMRAAGSLNVGVEDLAGALSGG